MIGNLKNSLIINNLKLYILYFIHLEQKPNGVSKFWNLVRESNRIRCALTLTPCKRINRSAPIVWRILCVRYGNEKKLYTLYVLYYILTLQELEKKLRDILSERDLTDMNITIYNCINCGISFTRELKKNYRAGGKVRIRVKLILYVLIHETFLSLQNFVVRTVVVSLLQRQMNSPALWINPRNQSSHQRTLQRNRQ